ncbi:MAG: acyl carrier protein [Elusimicrobiota bacterium]|jgi:acyl carrier protein
MKENLRKFIVDNFSFGQSDVKFSDDESLLEKGLIDSTGVLELVTFLETKYKIHIEDNELIPDNLDSIEKMIRFVNRKVGKEA